MMSTLYDSFNVDVPIERVDAYLFVVDYARHFSWGAWEKRLHWILRLEAGGQVGWGEALCPHHTEFNLPAEWADALAGLKGKTTHQAAALSEQNRGQWPSGVMELIQMALIDLEGRLSSRTVKGVLGLEGEGSIPGLFCILEKESARVCERARVATEKGLTSHVKLKLFGDSEKDREVITSARSILGSETFLVGDVNFGYPADDTLVGSMTALHEAGLDACEDPARMSVEGWVALQQEVKPLALIPDVPLRPAWNNEVRKGMGQFYNLHPGCLGSLFETIALAKKIKSWGHQLMIGDNSLIGPACTFWQQLSIGMGAAWVEALEKPDECDAVLNCITEQCTALKDGKVVIEESSYSGMGLTISTDRLRRFAQCIESF